LLLGANCPLARTGEYLGYWNGDCVARSGERLSSETAARVAAQTAAYEANPFRFPPVVGVAAEAEQSSAQTRTARTQIADDPAGTVGAVPARLARGLGVFWTASQTYQEGFEGRDTTWEQRGRWFHLVLVLPWAALAIVAVGWRRSRAGAALRAVGAVRRLVPSLAVLGTWCVVTMATYGSARFRTTVEPSLAVLAALGIVTAATVITARVRGQAGRSEVAS
jgi:hypothetical protein